MRTLVTRKKAVLMLLFAAMLVPMLHATALGAENGSDGLVMAAKDQSGKLVQYRYNADRLLVHSQLGAVGINYTYSDSKLFAYAETNSGAIYSAMRDRENRISHIIGAKSVSMSVTYEGDSHTPHKVEVQFGDGRIETPYNSAQKKPGSSSTDYSLQAMDAILVSIYEAYALPETAIVAGFFQAKSVEGAP